MSSFLQYINSLPKMDTQDIAHDLSPFFTVHKNGTINRLVGSPLVPAPENKNGVRSKDVVVNHDSKVAVRMFLPDSVSSGEKLPLLVYFHGGGFCVESALSYFYTNYVSSLVSNCNVIAVSVDYRLAPENKIPACYNDSWEALKWVLSHGSGSGPDPWINDHADFGRVFLAGDSAGANISHTMATWVSVKEPGSGKLSGIILVHPFFGNDKPDRIWDYCCSGETGLDDPKLNPGADPNLLGKLGCEKVLVCIAENDFLKSRGENYYEALKKSEWKGEVELVETKGEGHVFHLFDPKCEKAGSLMKRVGAFINNDKVHSLL